MAWGAENGSELGALSYAQMAWLSVSGAGGEDPCDPRSK